MSLRNPVLPDASDLRALKPGQIHGVFAMHGTRMSMPTPTSLLPITNRGPNSPCVGPGNGRDEFEVCSDPPERAAARVMPAIHDREGNNQAELAVIAQAFATNYQDLYARDPLLRLAEEGSIVWDLPVSIIPSNLVQDLDQPLTAEEIDAAISGFTGENSRAG
ncbi:hypothetical protein NDU88_005001 [Pleurodeles waltl]|uniref:Uncharacterized protein n=1 Tax=Pleurodeles waltl TaxID=8319 RepID=A0AAV7MV14_PLEWA|nr:hypothetical protein NDU88_005001 [Pleurodeles waltl]